MSSYITFMLLGLGAGSAYAALGMGIVLIYRGSGVLNFAYGTMVGYVAFTYSELNARGNLVLPFIGFPAKVDLGEPMSTLPALSISLVVGAVLGLAVHFLVFRPLRYAPALAKVVASVGLMLTLQAIVLLRFGSDNRGVASILPGSSIKFLGLQLLRDRLYFTALVVIAGIALWAVYRYTHFGLVTRAATENERGALLLGYSPSQLAGINWVIASVLGGAAGVLLAPISGLNAVNYSLFVVPALAAALVGRFDSISLTLIAGLLIGMLQSLMTKLQGDHSWIPRFGVKEGLPFVVVIVAMYLGGRAVAGRGELTLGRQPLALAPRRVGPLALGCTVVAVALLALLHGTYRFALIVTLIGVVLSLSLVVLTGFVGQISLAQMAFAGTSAFTLSKLSHGVGIPFPIAPLLGAGVATVLGVLVGVPALRIRGVNLAVVTLAAAVAIEEFVFKNPTFSGGFKGAPVPEAGMFGVHFGSGSDFSFGIFVLAVTVLAALLVVNVRRGSSGRRMLAVRANERAAAACGVSVPRTKLVAFALSSFIAGLGGALIAYQRLQVSFDSFTVFVSLNALALAYLGGIAMVSGGVVGGALASGGIVFVALDRWIGFGKYEILVAGISLIITAILNPDGIAGGVRLMAGLVAQNRRLRRPVVAAEGTIAQPTGVELR